MYKNIKNILGAVCLAGVMAASTACSDSFFDISNPNQPSSNTFWANENDALMALTACYDGMQDGALYNDYLDGWKYGFLLRECGSDNGDFTWSGWMLGSAVKRCTSGTNDESFMRYWNANYEVIKRCNLLIQNIDRVPMDADKIAEYKAEAIALRGLMYCNLISMFRDVPYLTTPLTLSESKAAKTPRAEIVASVIADMKANNDKLPAKGTESVGRMTREAAYAILGRIALFTQNWQEAVDAYKKVYGKASLFTYGDGSDPVKNFRELFLEPNEACDEVLLSCHYVGPGQGEGQTFSICWAAPMNAVEASMNLCDDFYCTDGKPISESPLFEGSLAKGAHSKANPDMKRYNNRDPRMKATLMLPGMEWNGKIYGTPGAPALPATSTCCILKWFIPEKTADEYDGSLDFYIIRYAEVLLSYAEALNELGTASEEDITKLIDEVRARVNMPAVKNAEGTGLGQAKLREIIRHERRVELAFEDLRLPDLYRWNQFAEGQKRMQHDREFYGFGSETAGTPRGPQDSVWPIPQSEIDTNDMLEQHAEWK